MSNLVELLTQAGPDDLAAIEAEIEHCKQELARLRNAAKLVRTLLADGSKMPRRTRNTTPPPVPDTEPKIAAAEAKAGFQYGKTPLVEVYRLRVLNCIEQYGPQRTGQLAKRCGIPLGSIHSVLKDPRFVFTETHGYSLKKST